MRRRFATPRPLHVAIAAVLAAILLPGGIILVAWLYEMAKRGDAAMGAHPARDIGIAVLHLAIPGLVAGWPLAALVAWRARHSILANFVAFVAFVLVAPAYELSQLPPGIPLLRVLAIFSVVFAIYGAVAVGIALLLGRIWRRREDPKIGELSATFE